VFLLILVGLKTRGGRQAFSLILVPQKTPGGLQGVFVNFDVSKKLLVVTKYFC